MMDVKLTSVWTTPLKLDKIRKAAAGTGSDEFALKVKDLVLLKSSRLSVQPVKACEWEAILALRDEVV
jgi:predicted RNA-binding protein with PUA-like domain